MATKIDWVKNPDGTQGETWNPIRGCSKVSPGCENCYAEKMAARFSGPGQPYEGLIRDGRWTGDVRLIEKALAQPLRWRKPRMVFVNSMSDLFHSKVSIAKLERIFRVMEKCVNHTFIVLTKRPKRVLKVWDELERRLSLCRVGEPWPLPNVWLGVSVEDQQTADERIPLLLEIPAAVRFVSVEPMLGPVDLRRSIALSYQGHVPNMPDPDWIINGCEGNGGRPMHEDWARSLRDQCQAAGIPYFLKQLRSNGKLVKMPQLDGKVWYEMPGRHG